MTRKQTFALASTAVIMIAVAYVSLYLASRERDTFFRPYYLIITYGEDRLVARCAHPELIAEAKEQITDFKEIDSSHYQMYTNGLFVVMNKQKALVWQRIFWPLETCELKQISFSSPK